MIRVLKHAVLGLGALAAVSCTSLGETRAVSSLGTEDLDKIQVFENQLLASRSSQDAQIRDDLDRKLVQVLEKGSTNKAYLARFWGLRAEVAWDRKDPGYMAQFLKEIDKTNSREARRFLTLARLETEVPKAVILLEKALEDEASEDPGWLQLELARLKFQAGDYRGSAAAYDGAFALLPSGVQALYKKNRDMAFGLKDQAPGLGQKTWAVQDPMTLEALLGLTLETSKLLDPFTLDKKVNLDTLAQVLREKNILGLGALNQAQTRSLVAQYLGKLAALWKKKPDLLGLKSLKASPIPDLSLDHPALGAAMLLVTWEVMDLPDGVNFFPERTLSSVEFLKILEKLKKTLR